MSAKQLQQLFAGLTRAYGTYTVTGVNAKKGKAEGKATTVQQKLTELHWADHIAGKQGIGVVPIRDDNTVRFAAIDIDVYDLDLKILEGKCTTLKLPLVLCRTKSGGAHLYLFLKEPVEAERVREKMAEFAVALGFPGVEIFPKQSQLAGPGDVGNWINMPYFDASRTTRYAIYDGKALDLEAFIRYAHAMAVTGEELEDTVILPPTDIIAEGAPPCLATLAAHGIPEGSRNNALFNFAVLARLMKGTEDESWHDKLSEFNNDFMTPPLPLSEVNALIKSFGKKEYFYKCKDHPINSVCNKDLCRKCEFGIGGNGDDPGVSIDGLTKICTDPPMWIVQVNSKRIQVETQELLSQAKFAAKCVETINFFPVTMKPAAWKTLINAMLSDVREVEAPQDAGRVGMFMYHLEQFCTTRAPANSKDEMLLGKSWHDDGRTHFRAADLLKYLDQQRFRDVKGNEIYAVMRQNIDDMQHHFDILRGKGTNYWSVPAFEEQLEDFDTPQIEPEEF